MLLPLKLSMEDLRSHSLSFADQGKEAFFGRLASSFALKKPAKSILKVKLDDDLDLIDEDSLLTEEVLKKPQLPLGNKTQSNYLSQSLSLQIITSKFYILFHS